MFVRLRTKHLRNWEFVFAKFWKKRFQTQETVR